MASVSEFVAAAVKADPALSGSDDKDQATIKSLEGETESLSKDLNALNLRLKPITYLHSNAPSSADISLYCHLHPSFVSAPAAQHPELPAVLRYFLHIQALGPTRAASMELPNAFPPLDIDIASLPTPAREVVVPAKKEKKAKAADAAAAGASTEGIVAQATAAVGSAATAVVDAAKGAVAAVTGSSPADNSAAPAAAAAAETGETKKGKKEKKEKPAKAPTPAKAEPAGPMPSMIDMRVGKVLEVSRHPDADSLYVEKIDVGEAEPRTVCSGLVKYMKEEDIMGATIIVICNLKPVTMRGVKSFAMLLCASAKSADGAEKDVEFVFPPAGSQPGERIYFEGEKYENEKPEDQLNPKKKVFESIQPGFTTLENLEAAWVDPETQTIHRIRTKDGICKAKSFVGASLS